ncbi:DNA-binding transcription factor yap1 [Tieghemiomyces parasiticus]|uniref:DNA-binding transcription factor yap1 n=1 Tax=Tieghemiomyces parasiticus TaxID=78921 RepID=A0A9W7ZP33_9FUNG|nr:DNA-binding transcription factor yap1 [Tieghemiomyces parasiticus]
MSNPSVQRGAVPETDAKRKSQFSEATPHGPPAKVNHDRYTAAVHTAQKAESSDGNDDGAAPRKPGRKLITTDATSKRTAQNRAAQRAFRERKQRYVEELEEKVKALEQSNVHTAEQNSQLKLLVERLRNENSQLKGGAFTFDMTLPAATSSAASTVSPITSGPIPADLTHLLSQITSSRELSFGNLGASNAFTTLPLSTLDPQQLLNVTSSPPASGTYGAVATAVPLVDGQADASQFGLTNALFSEYQPPSAPISHRSSVNNLTGAAAAVGPASYTPAPVTTSSSPPYVAATYADGDFLGNLGNPFTALPFADVYDFSAITMLNDPSQHGHLASQPPSASSQTVHSVYPNLFNLDAFTGAAKDGSGAPRMFSPTSPHQQAYPTGLSNYLTPPVTADHLNNTEFYNWLTTPSSTTATPESINNSNSQNNPMFAPQTASTPDYAGATPPSASAPWSNDPSPSPSHAIGSTPALHTVTKPNVATTRPSLPRQAPILLDQSEDLCKPACRMADSELDELCRELEVHAKCSEYKKMRKLMESQQAARKGLSVTGYSH